MNVSGFISQPTYLCSNCGYMGSFYLEVDPHETGENLVDLEKFKKDFPDDIETEENDAQSTDKKE